MKKLLFVAIAFIFCNYSFGQLRFVDASLFTKKLNQGISIETLELDFDLLEVCMLDTLSRDQILNFKPELESELEEYLYALKLNEKTVGFFTTYTGLEEIFNEEESRILNCLFSEMHLSIMNSYISYPICTNKNTALITVISNSSEDTYYFAYNRGVVQLKWVGGIIE